jgi:hypothetical protein
VEIIQSGISEIVAPSLKNTPDRWLNSVRKAAFLLEEAGIKYRTIELEKDYL